MRDILDTCIEIIQDLVGHGLLYFDHPIEIRLTPHSHPFSVWGVCVSPHHQLFIMDREEQWHPLEPTDLNADLMIGSLYQRLRLLSTGYAKAS